MISAVIPTLNSEATLATTLEALIPAVVEGVVREVIVADGGSTDRTLKIADQSGARVVTSETGRGLQLKSGAAAAKMPWLLFLHADTVLDPGWERVADQHIDKSCVNSGRIRQRVSGSGSKTAASRRALWKQELKLRRRCSNCRMAIRAC